MNKHFLSLFILGVTSISGIFAGYHSNALIRQKMHEAPEINLVGEAYEDYKDAQAAFRNTTITNKDDNEAKREKARKRSEAEAQMNAAKKKYKDSLKEQADRSLAVYNRENPPFDLTQTDEHKQAKYCNVTTKNGQVSASYMVGSVILAGKTCRVCVKTTAGGSTTASWEDRECTPTLRKRLVDDKSPKCFVWKHKDSKNGQSTNQYATEANSDYTQKIIVPANGKKMRLKLFGKDSSTTIKYIQCNKSTNSDGQEIGNLSVSNN